MLLAFRHLPLAGHPFARGAAEAGQCANAQGQFWPLHDKLFSNQTELDAFHIHEAAQRVGLDMARFDHCLESDVGTLVSADARQAKSLGISGTPTFMVGTRLSDGRIRVLRVLSGMQPIDKFVVALEDAHAR